MFIWEIHETYTWLKNLYISGKCWIKNIFLLITIFHPNNFISLFQFQGQKSFVVLNSSSGYIFTYEARIYIDF